MVILGQEKEIEIRKDFRKEGTDHNKVRMGVDDQISIGVHLSCCGNISFVLKYK